MFQEPDDVDRAHLCDFVSSKWGLRLDTLIYEPVGFGTHHYKATDADGNRWFVNVDELDPFEPTSTPDDEFGWLDRKLRTSVALKQAGLDFVHAPSTNQDGCVLERYDEDDDYAVSVYAWVDGTSADFGPYRDDQERRRVLRAIGQMHAATDQVPSDLPLRDDLEVLSRPQFFEALNDLDQPWMGGPYSEPTRLALIDNEERIRGLFDTYDELRAKISRDDWVVTHGEPHAANIIRTGGESFVLIDWDTVALGPRERDVWMLQPKDGDWSDYATPIVEFDPVAVELFDRRWTLTEITLYTSWFRGPHVEDKDTRFAFPTFEHYLKGQDDTS